MQVMCRFIQLALYGPLLYAPAHVPSFCSLIFRLYGRRLLIRACPEGGGARRPGKSCKGPRDDGLKGGT